MSGRQRLSTGSHFPIHGSTVLSSKYMICVFSVLWCSAVANGELACEDHEDPVNLLQHGGVHDKVNLTTIVDAQVVQDIDMEPVMQCLRLTTPNLQTLKYPKDAEEHFEALHKELAPWLEFPGLKYCYQGYCGPWIENQWISTGFMSRNRSGKKSRKRLAEDFGPFIPILMPWNDLLHTDFLEYDKMLQTLQKSFEARCCIHHHFPIRCRPGGPAIQIVRPPFCQEAGDHENNAQCVGCESWGLWTRAYPAFIERAQAFGWIGLQTHGEAGFVSILPGKLRKRQQRFQDENAQNGG